MRGDPGRIPGTNHQEVAKARLATVTADPKVDRMLQARAPLHVDSEGSRRRAQRSKRTPNRRARPRFQRTPPFSAAEYQNSRISTKNAPKAGLGRRLPPTRCQNGGAPTRKKGTFRGVFAMQVRPPAEQPKLCGASAMRLVERVDEKIDASLHSFLFTSAACLLRRRRQERQRK